VAWREAPRFVRAKNFIYPGAGQLQRAVQPTSSITPIWSGAKTWGGAVTYARSVERLAVAVTLSTLSSLGKRREYSSQVQALAFTRPANSVHVSAEKASRGPARLGRPGCRRGGR
jgi:hypothetical protein